MAHERPKQSTGSWTGNKERHQDVQKQGDEKKKQNDDWIPKGETNAERAQREQRRDEEK
jgi:hypothetical protein